MTDATRLIGQWLGLTGKRGEGGVVRFPPSIPLIHSWIVKSGLLRVLYRINSLAILFFLDYVY